MSDVNPFEPPKTDHFSPTIHADDKYPGVWRDGKLLVMHKKATLPPRCIKSNASADLTPLKRSLSWHHPAIFFTILIGLLIYIVVALIMTKRAKINIWLSPEWKARRRNRMLISWTLVLASMGAMVGGIMVLIEQSQPSELGPLLLFGGICSLIGFAIFGLVSARMVVPTRITDTHVWLKGVHPDYLADIQPLP